MDFSACVTLYKDFIKQSSSNDRQLLNVAAHNSNDGNAGNENLNLEVKDRWYELSEWKLLSGDQQKKFSAMRLKRKRGEDRGNGGGGRRGGKDSKSATRKVAKLEKKIKNQQRQLAAFNSKSSDMEESDSSSEEVDDPNRKHSALTRQGKKQKKVKFVK